MLSWRIPIIKALALRTVRYFDVYWGLDQRGEVGIPTTYRNLNVAVVVSWWVAIVLAAMYMLRAVSGVLHREVGPAVRAEALDLRPVELAVVVPLLGCLLALSAWPQAISGHSFGPSAQQAVSTQLAGTKQAVGK